MIYGKTCRAGVSVVVLVAWLPRGWGTWQATWPALMGNFAHQNSTHAFSVRTSFDVPSYIPPPMYLPAASKLNNLPNL